MLRLLCLLDEREENEEDNEIIDTLVKHPFWQVHYLRVHFFKLDKVIFKGKTLENFCIIWAWLRMQLKEELKKNAKF